MSLRRIFILTALVAVSVFGQAAEAGKLKLAVLKFSETGQEAKAREVGTLIADTLETVVAKTGRFESISRGTLEQTLTKESISAESLSEPSQALKLGLVSPVNVVLTGSVALEGQNLTINVKFIDTSNGQVKLTETIQATGSNFPVALSGLSDKITSVFPLQATILQIQQDGKVILDIGFSTGLTPDYPFATAYTENKLAPGITQETTIGVLRVAEVSQQSATADVVAQLPTQPVRVGLNVRFFSRIPATATSQSGSIYIEQALTFASQGQLQSIAELTIEGIQLKVQSCYRLSDQKTSVWCKILAFNRNESPLKFYLGYDTTLVDSNGYMSALNNAFLGGYQAFRANVALTSNVYISLELLFERFPVEQKSFRLLKILFKEDNDKTVFEFSFRELPILAQQPK